MSTVNYYDDVVKKSKPIFQGLNFNRSKDDDRLLLTETENYDENQETMVTTTDDVITVTPDSGEVIAKSKAIFRRKTTLVVIAPEKVRPDGIDMVNLGKTINHRNETTTNKVSQSVSDSTTTVQTDRTVKSDLVIERATSKSSAENLLFNKQTKTSQLNVIIDSNALYVPRIRIKINNEIDNTNHNKYHNVLRYKRDVNSAVDPHIQYAPEPPLKNQLSSTGVVPPKPKLSQSYGPTATRTTTKQVQFQNNTKESKQVNLNKKFKMSKKYNNVLKKKQDIMTENIKTIEKSKKMFQNFSLEVIDMKSRTEIIKTKSVQNDGNKKFSRFKRGLTKASIETVATIEDRKKITSLYITPNSGYEQTVPIPVLQNLNNTLTKNLSEAVNEVFNDLNMAEITAPENNLLGADLLFKVPSKYL